MLTSSFLPILGREECAHAFQIRREPGVEGAQKVRWERRAAWIPSQSTAFLSPAVLDSGVAISVGRVQFKADLMTFFFAHIKTPFSPALRPKVPSLTQMPVLLLFGLMQDVTGSLPGAGFCVCLSGSVVGSVFDQQLP